MKRNFHRIWIAMEKPLVKRAPGKKWHMWTKGLMGMRKLDNEDGFNPHYAFWEDIYHGSLPIQMVFSIFVQGLNINWWKPHTPHGTHRRLLRSEKVPFGHLRQRTLDNFVHSMTAPWPMGQRSQGRQRFIKGSTKNSSLHSHVRSWDREHSEMVWALSPHSVQGSHVSIWLAEEEKVDRSSHGWHWVSLVAVHGATTPCPGGQTEQQRTPSISISFSPQSKADMIWKEKNTWISSRIHNKTETLTFNIKNVCPHSVAVSNGKLRIMWSHLVLSMGLHVLMSSNGGMIIACNTSEHKLQEHNPLSPERSGSNYKSVIFKLIFRMAILSIAVVESE